MICVMSEADSRFYEVREGDRLGRLLDYLNRLDTASVHYTLAHTRPD
jgi:hypothetical protein